MARYQLTAYPQAGSQIAFARVAIALAVMSVGALAIGALAIGRLAIKRVAIVSGRRKGISFPVESQPSPREQWGSGPVRASPRKSLALGQSRLGLRAGGLEKGRRPGTR